MKKILHPASTRGTADYGWLQANYSFSFASYFNPNRIQFGQLRVLNDDRVAPGAGFGTHPHQNMEIVTIPQEGALRHKDSTGGEGVIAAGDIQIMSAGSGVEHSEMNASSTEPVSLFQIWVLPETKNVPPRYDQKKIASLMRENELCTVIKPKDKASKDELWLHQQAYFSLGKFNRPTETTYTLHNKSHGVYVFVISGAVTVTGENLAPRDAIGIWEIDAVTITTTENSHILVIEVPMDSSKNTPYD
jgi:redox-sensitive bicupin YhaK (pirin superfamily)